MAGKRCRVVALVGRSGEWVSWFVGVRRVGSDPGQGVVSDI